MLRQSHFIAVAGAFLIGCAVLLFVGCAGGRSEAPEEQGHTEATREQAHSPEATTEEARCEGTRTFMLGDVRPTKKVNRMTTNDIPGCPYGGLLLGTDKHDNLDGKKGEDEIHGLGAFDYIEGGDGNDVIYGGPGADAFNIMCADEGDDVLYGGDGNDFMDGCTGEDVLYGGDGNDDLIGLDYRGLKDTQKDELYCGPGKDRYDAGKLDYVDSSCEKLVKGL